MEPRRFGALRRLLSRRIAVVGGMLLCVIVLLGLLAPLLTPYGPNDLSISNRLQPPSADHPFGTDNLGRDVYSRVAYGGRVSLSVGFGAVVAAGLAGQEDGAGDADLDPRLAVRCEGRAHALPAGREDLQVLGVHLVTGEPVGEPVEALENLPGCPG